jgi:DNA polymerase elongation subunit (family B)
MLLRELMTDLEPYDAVSGWNLGSSWDERKMVNGQWVTIPGEGFDAPLLRARMRRLATDQRALERFMQQWLWSDFMQLYKRANTAAASGEEKQSYRLDHVARMVLGEGKHDFDSKECWEYWSAGGAKRQKMADYCLRDTEILVDFIALYQAITSVCHGFLDTHGIKPTELIDGIMLRMGAEMGYRFPTKPSFYPTRNKFPGAYVMEPQQTGIIRDVHVADFAALYPSIFITWNMSPETKGKAGCVAPTTGVTFAKAPKGMLPMALEKLLDLRGEWKKKAASLPPGTPEWKEADRMSTALKVAANGFYGCVGSKYSRFYDREIAESVTQTGVFLIKQTLAAAEAA